MSRKFASLSQPEVRQMAARIAAIKTADRPGTRIYEYTAEDGTQFWTFTKYPQTIIAQKRLTLQSRIGTHLVNYLNWLRVTGLSLSNGQS